MFHRKKSYVEVSVEGVEGTKRVKMRSSQSIHKLIQDIQAEFQLYGAHVRNFRLHRGQSVLDPHLTLKDCGISHKDLLEFKAPVARAPQPLPGTLTPHIAVTVHDQSGAPPPAGREGLMAMQRGTTEPHLHRTGRSRSWNNLPPVPGFSGSLSMPPMAAAAAGPSSSRPLSGRSSDYSSSASSYGWGGSSLAPPTGRSSQPQQQSSSPLSHSALPISGEYAQETSPAMYPSLRRSTSSGFVGLDFSSPGASPAHSPRPSPNHSPRLGAQPSPFTIAGPTDKNVYPSTPWVRFRITGGSSSAIDPVGLPLDVISPLAPIPEVDFSLERKLLERVYRDRSRKMHFPPPPTAADLRTSADELPRAAPQPAMDPIDIQLTALKGDFPCLKSEGNAELFRKLVSGGSSAQAAVYACQEVGYAQFRSATAFAGGWCTLEKSHPGLSTTVMCQALHYAESNPTKATKFATTYQRLHPQFSMELTQTDIFDALQLFDCDQTKCENYLKAYSQVKNFGYPKEQVQAALLAADCNVEQAVQSLLS
mmetsp:Transcript_15577/g.46666  ORF Transcript_15577/g.46666 Transcript_15577/m.46666 type:complete len:535 (+) Transcript_15577:255-1859(+)|eukprot:CAMPEP_0177641470 /NCGR_PEP_ID=MMETSP0447-20121125/7080_1 /TAXON_ID=0 /ORGANISM="Stygamoeba regulata, Strain BSH-02190019" /LENGTH=534 /DNA_ID=CAMNT_0019143583 /DNA_START=67 /DNA_END=1671 /DNA_ORIENTATION=-